MLLLQNQHYYPRNSLLSLCDQIISDLPTDTRQVLTILSNPTSFLGLNLPCIPSYYNSNKMSDSRGALKNVEDPSTKELNAFVQNLLKQMQERFEDMSGNIIGRIDEMGNPPLI